MKSHHRPLLLLLMTIRKELNYQMEIFWSGVKAVQVEKYTDFSGPKRPRRVGIGVERKYMKL